MGLFKFESYYDHNSNKKLKKDISKKIREILNPYTLSYVFDYKIIHFIITVLDTDLVEVSIFGYGKPDLDDNVKKQDALVKFIFQKGKKIWTFKYKKSKIYRKIENRDSETKSENIFEIKDKILSHLNKK